MSVRQINITLSDEQQKYAREHPEETIKEMAKKFNISPGKLSANLKLMGIPRSQSGREYSYEKADGTFDEKTWAKMYIY